MSAGRVGGRGARGRRATIALVGVGVCAMQSLFRSSNLYSSYLASAYIRM